MAVESPPFALQAGSYGAEITRRAIGSILARSASVGSIAGGLVASTDCALTPPASGMSVNVGPGEVWVPGSSSASQSGYYCRVSSTTNLAIAASDPTNPRIDRVSAVVTDAAYSGATNTFAVAVETGTPTSGANLTNLSGVAAAPASSLTLGYVLVPATSTNVTGGNISAVAPLLRAGLGGTYYQTGTDAGKPASAAGLLYQATDSGALYFGDGSTLHTVYGSRGAVSIPGAQSTSSTTYTTLATPDKVTVVLPTNGLIVVAYQALWQNTVGGNARAAIFVGANQIKGTIEGGIGGAPGLQEVTGNATVNIDTGLHTGFSSAAGTGLVSGSNTGNATEVTTGQVVGSQNNAGGPVLIFAAAGTYDVSVQFKNTVAGTLTAKNRHLWVWTICSP